MALIGKIRQKTGILLGFIGVSLFIFLIQEAISSNSMMGGAAKSLGKINGKKVKTTDFFDEVNQYEQRIKVLNPSAPMNEESSLLIREEVWNNFAVRSILGKTFEQLGLTVNANELADAFKGDNIHPYVMNFLGQAFVNPQTGQFDKAQMVNALNNMDQFDPSLRQIVLQLEGLVEEDRERAKYTSLVTKSAYVPAFIAKDNLEANKVTTADILSVSYASIDDKDIQVTDKDIENYIRKYPSRFKQEASVVLDVVTFDIRPSGEDQVEIRDGLLKIKDELAATDEDSLLIARSSAQGSSVVYLTSEQFARAGRAFADTFATKPVGSFIGPYGEGNNLVLTYIVDRKPVADSVKASRIILGYRSAEDVAAKKALADQIVADVKSGAATFAQKAMEFSDDQATKANGGDLGFFPQGAMEPELNNKLFYEMSVGQIEIIEAQSGVYILQKTGQTGLRSATRIADFTAELAASDNTAKEIYNEANQFWVECKTAAEFDKKAKGQNLRKNLTVVPGDISAGGIEGSRSVVAWAFKEAKPGEVNFFDLTDKYVVVKMVARKEAGLAGVSDVKDQVKDILIKEKKGEILAKRLKEAGNTSLEDIAAKVKGQVYTAIPVQYTMGFVENIGNEPKLVGAIFGVPQGKISSPVIGANGVYLVKAQPAQKLSGEVDTALYKKQLFRMASGQMDFNTIFGVLKSEAEIEDQRYQVY